MLMHFLAQPVRIVLRYFSAHKPTLLHNFSRNSLVFYRFPAVDGAIEMERKRQKREWHFCNLWWECFNFRDIMQLLLLIAARASTKVMQLVSTLASDLNSWRHCNSPRRLVFRMIRFHSDKSFTELYGRNFYNIKTHWNQIKQLFFSFLFNSDVYVKLTCMHHVNNQSRNYVLFFSFFVQVCSWTQKIHGVVNDSGQLSTRTGMS